MSFRPVATRSLDKDQFKKDRPPPIPNSANCPRYMEQPTMNGGVFGSSGFVGNGGNGRMPFPQQNIRKNFVKPQSEPVNLYNRKTVFNFIDRGGIDTRNGGENDSFASGGATQMYGQVQHSSFVDNNFLRPQNSRDINHSYFNRNSGNGLMNGSMNGSNSGLGSSSMSSVAKPLGGTSRNDEILQKYSNMYSQNGRNGFPK